MRKLIILLVLLSSMQLYAQNKWSSLRLEETSSPKNDIRSICFDKQGNLWAGTYFGVYKMESNQWTAQSPENIYVQSLFIEENNTKWIALWSRGLHKSQKVNEWTQIETPSPYSSVNIVSSHKQGNIWVGFWDSGLMKIDKTGKASRFDLLQLDKGDNSILSITCDAKGKMWFGSYHGLSSYDGQSWTAYNVKNSMIPHNEVQSICPDKKGNIWVGTTCGIARFDGSKWTVYKKEKHGLASDLGLSIAEDSKGNIWVGSDNGISVFNGVRWKIYNTANSALIDNRVQTITVRNNKVYLGTSHGISIIE